MEKNVVLHPGTTHLRPTSTITGEKKGGRTAPTESQLVNSYPRRALTGLRTISRAISREFCGLGTSIRGRAVRIAKSRTAAQAFVEAFSVIPPSQVQTPHVQRTGFDSAETIQSQDTIAKKLLLPTTFAQVRDGKSALSLPLTRSTIPEVLTIDYFREASPAVLDKFLEHSLQEKSAENLFFLIAAEKLLSLRGVEKSLLAFRMDYGFTKPDAPLEPNFSGNTKSRVQSLLNDLAANRDRPDQAQVIEEATRNLLQSFGADAYKRWRQTLPA